MLHFNSWFNEGYGTNYNNLIVVDIQPEYARNIRFLPEFVPFLQDTLARNRKVIYFYNGSSIGSNDTPDEIIQWFFEYIGGDEDQFDDIYTLFKRNILWFDKGYGFFRPWMDQGLEPDVLIRVIRYMVMKRMNDSSDIDPETLEQLVDGIPPRHDPLYLPDISLGLLKQFSGAFMCGGGRSECLKEVEILMNAFNIRYTLLNRFVF